MEILLSGKMYSAIESLSIGLIDDIINSTEINDKTQKIAEKIKQRAKEKEMENALMIDPTDYK